MTATIDQAPEQAQHGGAPRRRGRSTPVIAVLATLLALWLGLTAPAVSPVAPDAATAGLPATAAQDAPDGGLDLGELLGPADGDDPGGGGGGGGRGGRGGGRR